MDAVVKLLFDILAFSSIMVLVVLGLAVIASMMGIFNLGHGELVLMGAYTVFVFRELRLPVWSGMIVASFVVAFLLAVAFKERSENASRHKLFVPFVVGALAVLEHIIHPAEVELLVCEAVTIFVALRPVNFRPHFPHIFCLFFEGGIEHFLGGRRKS